MKARNGVHLTLLVLLVAMFISSKFSEIPLTNRGKEVQFARTDSLSESPNLPLSKLTLKNELKAFCDIYTEGPICLGNGSRVISKALNMDGIVGDFVFTQKITVDQSGYSNRALGVANVRPGLGGLGSAAYFKKKHFLEIRHIEQYNSKELTVVMWVHLRRTWSTEELCPLLVKGLDAADKKQYSRSPGIFINQKTGTVYASFSKESNKLGDTARTLGYLRPGKWNQIAVVFKPNAIKIYLNGVLDGFAVIKDDSPVVKNKDSLFLGGHPRKPKKCNLEVTIDSLKLYERELKAYEIQAGVRTAFGIVEPSYFHLSCFNCSLQDAQSKCVQGYKLCSSEDMYSGVWQAAHLMGWVNTRLIQTDLGYYIFVDGTEKSDVKGMGVCCRVLN